MSNEIKTSAVKPKHRLLAQSRQWHKWGGLIAGAFLIVVGASGIVLNYKKPIFTALGLERDAKEMKAGGKMDKPVKNNARSARFTTANGMSAATVTVDQALALARETWGDVRLERIELKDEHGELIYKIKERGGAELWVNAATGNHFVKGEYERVKAKPGGEVMARTTDWGKILIDLHTGKIGGEVGKTIMSLAALLLLLLTFSGVYLWLKPLLIRRQKAKAQTPTVEPATIPKAEPATAC
jgi:uncharacterized iron-regulated membrane protein